MARSGVGAGPHGQGRSVAGRLVAVLLPLAALGVVLGVVQVLASRGVVHPLVLPAPTAIWRAGLEIASEPAAFRRHLLTTLTEVVAGYGLGVAAGMGLALAAAQWPRVKRSLHPLVVFVQSFPKVILAPLMLVWFGYGPASKVALVVWMVLFPVYVNTLSGLSARWPAADDLLAASVASSGRLARELRLRLALPHVFLGLRHGVVQALTGAVAAEFISGVAGLGVLVQIYTNELDTSHAIAAALIAAAVSLVLFWAMEALDRSIVFWREAAETQS